MNAPFGRALDALRSLGDESYQDPLARLLIQRNPGTNGVNGRMASCARRRCKCSRHSSVRAARGQPSAGDRTDRLNVDITTADSSGSPSGRSSERDTPTPEATPEQGTGPAPLGAIQRRTK